MIDIDSVLADIPHNETFCSVSKLDALVERLGRDSRFRVERAGASVNGVPIHHVSFGRGNVKALLVAHPHCMEPIGSLTVFNVLTLLEQGHPALMGADVEWHVIPCIDPDGALLNEGWTQQPFSPTTFLRHFYMQTWAEQVDTSFPVTYKRLAISDGPSQEGKVLRAVLDQVRPDFFFTLHNTFAGGAFFLLNRDIGAPYYERIHGLLRGLGFPLRRRPQFSEFLAQYAPGITEVYGVRKHYDYLEKSVPKPEEVLRIGAGSYEHLEQIHPGALVFFAELGYFDHPYNESDREIGENLRHFKLRVEADSKYLATLVLSTWKDVEGDFDKSNPHYRALVSFALPTEERIREGGMPISRYPSRDTLFNPAWDRPMTEGDVFEACVVNDGLKLLAFNYQFLQLLDSSPQTPAIRRAVARLEAALDDAYDEIDRRCDLNLIQPFSCDTMARVQLGSGLIALNSLLAQ
jgi:hypothetical protein